VRRAPFADRAPKCDVLAFTSERAGTRAKTTPHVGFLLDFRPDERLFGSGDERKTPSQQRFCVVGGDGFEPPTPAL
jgi:hypothetical protein